MSNIKRIRKTQQLRWGAAITIFAIINVVLRAALLPVNQAEYTDGIIQLTQLGEYTGIYPPLYTAFTWPLSFIFGQLWAGRLVSMLFSSAAVIPLFLLARRSFGMRAAVFAALVYTVAPVSLRWSTRVMTDAQFSFFFWFACERFITAQGAIDKKSCNSALTMASVLGVLAALTRYQGMLFIPAIIILACYKKYKRGWFPGRGTAWLLLYLLIPLWSLYAGNIHGSQFLERTAILGPWMTFLLSAEPFTLYIPYFLTYPVFILMMIGFTTGSPKRRYNLLPITLYVFFTLLVAQSLFSSFQERYFLPAYGLFYIWAGLGLAIIDDRCRHKYPKLRFYTPIATVVWCLFISTLVIIGSRQAFGDLRYAAEYAAEAINTQGKGHLYTNELYRPATDESPAIAGTKVAFYAKHPAYYIDEDIFTGRIRLVSGDLLVIDSRDDMGGQQTMALNRMYNLEELAVFESKLTPIFPDLMQNRQLEQSPAAWLYRYMDQQFSTTVYRVR